MNSLDNFVLFVAICMLHVEKVKINRKPQVRL